jgi:hypothetical protein
VNVPVDVKLAESGKFFEFRRLEDAPIASDTSKSSDHDQFEVAGTSTVAENGAVELKMPVRASADEMRRSAVGLTGLVKLITHDSLSSDGKREIEAVIGAESATTVVTAKCEVCGGATES